MEGEGDDGVNGSRQAVESVSHSEAPAFQPSDSRKGSGISQGQRISLQALATRRRGSRADVTSASTSTQTQTQTQDRNAWAVSQATSARMGGNYRHQ